MLDLIYPFNYADLTIGLVLLLCVLISTRRGAVAEVFAIGSIVAAIFVARSYGEIAAERYLAPRIDNPHIAYLVAAMGLFLATLLAGKAASYLFSQFVRSGPLRGADRLLGAIFGLARGTLVVCVALAFLALTRTPLEGWWDSSVLIGYLQPWAQWVVSLLPPTLAQYFEFPP